MKKETLIRMINNMLSQIEDIDVLYKVYTFIKNIL